ncbi:hypothetical protein NDU88_008252 [Pleurodeles waltl]|uniref:Uncharacterized protein n=1 Tax=Pleurodeles waltl TaxID=8319 RepID=A0AAV7N5U8_PLEWA|nr:hypothetical protein NDU88_008252 [Pleurodeles waltl]
MAQTMLRKRFTAGFSRLRVADFPATFGAGFGLAEFPGGHAENEAADVGNPDIRIPGNILMEKGQRARSAEEGEDTEAGNPDIWVPESIKSEEGLRGRRAEEEKDAEGRDAGSTEAGSSGEDEKKARFRALGRRNTYLQRQHQ